MNVPPPPPPLVLLPSGHPNNPIWNSEEGNHIPYIKVDNEGNYLAGAAPRRAVWNQNQHKYILAGENGGKRHTRQKKYKNKKTHKRNTRKNVK